ncbi:MAG: riboflavin synthase [Flavobacteriales bacterium]|nr:riboflavin synthase [Flavobacteriales bacterium]|tara:strand:- start:264851 stop:265438 length:588 start_codon:yes stop_codon:yes gene_type:complete
MFTGIVEELGEVELIKLENQNKHFIIKANMTSHLKIDQSVSHNGICLTVIDINKNTYTVTAINETLQKTNLNTLQIGDKVNLERSMKLGSRIDGHIVQGHVDQTAKCVNVSEEKGSHFFTFEFEQKNNITVEKGSICVNGVSLTVVNSASNKFSVAIIPYTFHNTNFHEIKKGSIVNLEFDIFGKYIAKMLTKKI